MKKMIIISLICILIGAGCSLTFTGWIYGNWECDEIDELLIFYENGNMYISGPGYKIHTTFEISQDELIVYDAWGNSVNYLQYDLEKERLIIYRYGLSLVYTRE